MKLHPNVEALTVESPLCIFCTVEGDCEIGLLHGFMLGTQTATGAVTPLCFDHRVRLSFTYELSDRLKSTMGGGSPR